MKTLTQKQQWLIAGILLVTMILTRGQIIQGISHSSWAIFFIVGFYLRNTLSFPLFFIVAFGIDSTYIQLHDMKNFCLTPAYPFLIPAYGSLWLAGRWLANHYREGFAGLFQFVSLVVVATSVFLFISKTGHYLFSDRYTDISLAGYFEIIAKYLPGYLQSTILYLSIAAIIHFAVPVLLNSVQKKATDR